MTISRNIKEMNRRLTVAVDIMFVSRIAVLVIVEHGIKLMTVEYVPNCRYLVLYKSLEEVCVIYLRRGFP